MAHFGAVGYEGIFIGLESPDAIHRETRLRLTSNNIHMSIKIQVRSNESLEAALRRFKRSCNTSGIFRIAKENTWHEKRSDYRRRERRERIRTIILSQRKHQARVRRG